MKQSMILIAAFTVAILSCGKEQQNNKNEETVTGSATSITECSALLSGYVNVAMDQGIVRIGIMCSTDHNPTVDNGYFLGAKELDANNLFTISASNLASNTTYYYKSIIDYGSIVRSGEVKSFTTNKIEANVQTGDAVQIEIDYAYVVGSIVVNTVAQLNKSAWFFYSSTEDSAEGLMSRGEKCRAELLQDGTIICRLNSLSGGQNYYYMLVVEVYDAAFQGNVKTFTTYTEENYPGGGHGIEL